LSTFMGVGGGTLLAYTALLVCALICAVVLFVVAYPRTKLLVVLMPAFVLIFSSRSFASYLVMLALPAVVAACSVRVAWADAPSVAAALPSTLTRSFGHEYSAPNWSRTVQSAVAQPPSSHASSAIP